MVTGIIELAGDEGLIQILSARALGQLDEIPWGAGSQGERDEAQAPAPARKVVVAAVGQTAIAVDVQHVLEIHEDLELEQTVSALSCLRGTVRLRGQSVFVMDLHETLNVSGAAAPGSRPMVFVHDADRVCALVVDEVLDVVDVDEADIVSVGLLRGYPSGRFFERVVRSSSGRDTLFLDVPTLFGETGFSGTPDSLSGRELITTVDEGDGWGDDDDDEAWDEELDTQSFLIFRVGEQPLCLELTAIQEIQELPESLLAMPSAGDALVGIMNLRGAILPVVDLRA